MVVAARKNTNTNTKYERFKQSIWTLCRVKGSVLKRILFVHTCTCPASFYYVIIFVKWRILKIMNNVKKNISFMLND